MLQNSVLILIMRYVRVRKGDMFLASTAVVMQEMLKLLSSLLLLFIEQGTPSVCLSVCQFVLRCRVMLKVCGSISFFGFKATFHTLVGSRYGIHRPMTLHTPSYDPPYTVLWPSISLCRGRPGGQLSVDVCRQTGFSVRSSSACPYAPPNNLVHGHHYVHATSVCILPSHPQVASTSRRLLN